MSKFSKHILPAMRENPPIPFVTKLKKLEAEGADSEKVESIRFERLVDLSNSATRFSKEFFVFKDGSPEEYIRWLMGYRDLELLMPLKEPSDRTKMLRTILKGRALSLFEYTFNAASQVIASLFSFFFNNFQQLVFLSSGF
jgi:hypothetical protein